MRIAGAALVVLIGLGMACASRGLPATRYYTLTGSPELPTETEPIAADGEAPGWTIAVELLEVAIPYDQDRLVHRASTGSIEVGFYNYHRWAAPLGRLAQAALLDRLAGASGVASVRVAGTGSPNAVLGGRVLHVEELAGADPRVRVAFELELRDPAGESLWTSGFTGEERARHASGAEVAAAVARVFDSLLDEARAALEAGLAALETETSG